MPAMQWLRPFHLAVTQSDRLRKPISPPSAADRAELLRSRQRRFLLVIRREDFNDSRGNCGDVVTTLGQNVVVARHADRCRLEIGHRRLQLQDIDEFRLIEPQDPFEVFAARSLPAAWAR